jgi:hypothetical protein
MDTTMLLVPLLVLGVVMAFAFAGCASFSAAPSTTTTPPEAQPQPTPAPSPAPAPAPAPTPTHPPDAYPKLVKGETGLRSYWRLGEAAGTTVAADSDPNQPRNGTYQGNPGLGAQGIPGNRTAPAVDTAANLDGTTGFVEVPYIDSANGALTNPAGTFSLEAWVKPGGPGIVLSSYSLALARGFVLEVVQGAGGLQAQARVGQGGGAFATVTNSLGPGADFDGWRHLVVTYENPGAAGIVKLYVNAGPPAQANGVSYKDVRPAQAPPLRIGAGWNEPQETQAGKFLKGGIDEVALYDSTLTPAQIQAHFDSGKQP